MAYSIGMGAVDYMDSLRVLEIVSGAPRSDASAILGPIHMSTDGWSLVICWQGELEHHFVRTSQVGTRDF